MAPGPAEVPGPVEVHDPVEVPVPGEVPVPVEFPVPVEAPGPLWVLSPPGPAVSGPEIPLSDPPLMGGTIGISPKAGTEARRLKLIAMLHILLKRFTMSVSPRVILYSVLCTITFILHRHTARSAVPP